MTSFKSLISASALLAGIASGQAIEPVSSNSSSGDAPTVDLGYVKYQGYSNASAGIDYFRGIQYAANPTGALRWQKPRPIEWANDFDPSTVYNAVSANCVTERENSTDTQCRPRLLPHATSHNRSQRTWNPARASLPPPRASPRTA